MTGEQMRTGLMILSPYGRVTVTAEHDSVWLHVDDVDYTEREVNYDWDPNYTDPDGDNFVDPSPVTTEDAVRLEEAGWSIDPEVGSWHHHT